LPKTRPEAKRSAWSAKLKIRTCTVRFFPDSQRLGEKSQNKSGAFRWKSTAFA
jgi:hypothetical protein